MPRRKKSEAEVQPEAGTEAVTEQVQQIAISELHPFEGHPFKVLDDETMAETVESIKQVGIANPLIVRPDPDGGYEIISGHRRHHAAGLAGLDALPVIVRELDDDAAVIMMVDSNIQRETILPSERAFAYKMKMDAIRHQGARPAHRPNFRPSWSEVDRRRKGGDGRRGQPDTGETVCPADKPDP